MKVRKGKIDRVHQQDVREKEIESIKIELTIGEKRKDEKGNLFKQIVRFCVCEREREREREREKEREDKQDESKKEREIIKIQHMNDGKNEKEKGKRKGIVWLNRTCLCVCLIYREKEIEDK